jgi:hypothetical protein
MLRAAALFITVVLAACTTPQSLKLGTPEADVRAALGRPTASLALPDGGSRLQYSGQPFNQSVWNADFDANRKLVRVDQMMSDESFARIVSGKATQDEVLRDFGPPAETFQYKLKNESAWMYRYFTHGGFKAAMFVYFDPAGIVKRTEPGLDPWAIRDGDRSR